MNTIAQAKRNLYADFLEFQLEDWLALVPSQLDLALNKTHNANIPAWHSAVARLPKLTDMPKATLHSDKVGVQASLTKSEQAHTTNLLKKLMPWRKGPFLIGDNATGVFIDTEWRSDFKWRRLVKHIKPLTGRRVLDVGGGSGYHAYRMAGAGAKFVVNIDPSPLFFYQFMAVRHFLMQCELPISRHLPHFLPIGLQSIPLTPSGQGIQAFDTVFSMGVLYHRPNPFEFINQLKACLRSGGELVLETLVIKGDENSVLVPRERYGKMANVYFIPSSAALKVWLEKCGFKGVQVVDEVNTSCDEQRTTDWMDFYSLKDFLDPSDNTKTVEGYPAPRRAIVLANKP